MKDWLKVFFLFFVCGLLVYFNSFNNQFLIDDHLFLANPVMSHTQYLSFQWSPSYEQNFGYYRPMAHMLYDLSYSIFKNNLWQYHLFNLLLFVLASSLIYLFMKEVSGDSVLALLTGL